MARYWRILTEMRAGFLYAFLFLFVAAPVGAVELSKSPRHYMGEIEHYYQKPRTEMLAPMLEAFGRAGILENAEKRMFLAAFLGELLKRGQARPEWFMEDMERLAPGARVTLAWAFHLGGVDGGLLSDLLGGGSDLLRAQILGMPSSLSAWEPVWEKSVIDMYWGAFMATGQKKWLEGIIETALVYARNSRSETGRHAAATLYEYAPRHAVVVDLLEARLKRANPAEKGVLQTIIEGVKKAPR